MASPNHESSVLGQILLLQSALEAAPTERHLAEMLEHGLKVVPGVKEVKFLRATDPVESGLERDLVRLAVKSRNTHYGEFRIALSSADEFAPYLPFVSNTVNLCSFQIGKMRTEELLRVSNLRLERLAEERNEKYKLLFEKISEGVLHLDERGKVLSANDAARDILGMDPVCLLQMDSPWIHPVREDGSEYPPAELPGNLALKERKAVSNVVFGVINPKTSSRTWLEMDAVPFLAPGSDGISVFALFRDITRRRQSETDLQASEQRFRTIMDHAPIGMATTSMNGKILMVNQAFCDMLGYGREELERTSFMEITHPEDKEITLPARNLLLTGEREAYRAEKRYIRKDGSVIRVRLTSTIVRGVCGAEPYFIGQVEDITRQKQVEEELSIAATTFESQNGVMITDAGLNILRVNKAFTEITGYAAEEIVGMHPRVLRSGRHDARFYEQMWSDIRNRGNWIGEIWNRRKNGSIYPETLSISAVRNEDGSVRTYVGTFIDITRRKEAEARVEHLAFYDQLTDLPNRRLLLDRLQRAQSASMRSGKKCTLLLIDLDNFKVINDTLGHAEGDELLQQAAGRLGACLREEDTLSRFGGDEFLVLIEGLSGDTIEASEQAKQVCRKLFDSIRRPFLLGQHECKVTCSIGATVFLGLEQPIGELIKQADIAMYEAKKAGRNSLRFFDRDVQELLTARALLEADLHNALEGGQIELHYQIQMDSLDRPVGAEALVRWHHPERGWVSPAQFIPLAEESGLILEIGAWVLDKACAQLGAWRSDPATRDLNLAVNISARQLAQAGFLGEVKAALQRHQADPAKLKLEITESMLLGNIEDTIDIMNELKWIGLQISLDDFGTGYSSLSYLKRLPLDQLKIDQSFVRDIATDANDRSIVQTIIAMAKSLGLDVIAEGVESEMQRAFLLENGCLNFQGYLYGRPMSIHLFERALQRRQVGTAAQSISAPLLQG